MIPSPEAIRLVIDVLNDVGCPYIVTGSIVSSAYSEPRATRDADFVVHAQASEFQTIVDRLKDDFAQEPQMAFETVTGKLQHKFQYRRDQFLVEVFQANFDDPHEKSRFDRRIQTKFLGRNTYFPTAEDVVIGKLRWVSRIRRPKDRDDVFKVLLHQRDTLDWAYLEGWCATHGTLQLLNELRAEVDERIRQR